MLILTGLLQSRAEEFTYDGINYTILTDNTCEIKAGGNGTAGTTVSGDVVIPETAYDSDGNAYTVTAVGAWAFDACYDLESVALPNTVTVIGEGAFYDCFYLTSVVMPNALTELGDCAFDSCFYLSSITIPDTVTSIGERLFRYCTRLASITIPNTITSIGDNAFDTCIGLTSVIIPNSVTEIGNEVFYGCKNLVKSAYPDSLSNPFTNGVAVSYPADDAVIENEEIWSSDKTKIYFVPVDYQGEFIIPNTVTTIATNAFAKCNELTAVTIPASVVSIEKLAFYYCNGLTNVNITDLVAWFGIAFDSATANPLSSASHLYLNGQEITELTIPESVTEIGDYIFAYSALKELTIPETVTAIGKESFTACLKLQKVISLSTTPPTCDADAFHYIRGVLYVPQSAIDSYKEATGWTRFSDVRSLDELDSGVTEIGDNSNAPFSVENGVICIDGDTDVRIVSMTGATVYSGRGATRIDVAPGIYIVISGNTATKVAVK
jgi:hypothetical protein